MCVRVPRKTCPRCGQSGKGHEPYSKTGSDTIRCADNRKNLACERVTIGDTKGKDGICGTCVSKDTYEQRKMEGQLTSAEQKAENREAAKQRLKLDVQKKKKDLWPPVAN